MSKDATGAYHQRLHALDLTSGTELLGGPTEIAATYPTAGGGITTFSPGHYEERAALLLVNGTLYTSWTSHCDIAPYSGWVIAYAEGTLARSAVLNVAPNGGAGKDGNIYVVDRDSLGRFNPGANAIWQQLSAALPLVPQSQSPQQFAYPGTAPGVSANGAANGIVWAHENCNPAVLHAYDAGNLATELYNSNQAAVGRDHFGIGNKYITPTVADGKVLVGTTTAVAVFGLLH